MKRNFLKVLTVSALAGGIVLSSTQVFAKNIDGIKPMVGANQAIMLAQNSSLQDGQYTVGVEIFKEKSEELSMAGQYINKKSSLNVRNGQMYITVNISRIDWMKNIKVTVNGNQINYDKVESGQSGKLTFKIPSTKANIKFNMNVVPMGNADVAFRVVLQNDITKLGGSTQNKSKSNVKKNNSSTTITTKKNITKESSKNVQSNKNTVEKTNNKLQDNVKVDNDNDNQKQNANVEQLPQTGYPIGQAGVLAIGQITTIAGLVLLKKKNK